MKILVSVAVALVVVVGCRTRSAAESGALADPTAPDGCLAGQDLDAADIDVSRCPPIPDYPGAESMPLGSETVSVSMGAWEIYPGYKYGTLVSVEGGRELHDQNDGVTKVDDVLLTCWAKAYYRLKGILANPPKEYIDLYQKGYQQRFFMFLSDKRQGQGAAWGGRIAAYQDHLVKWNFTVDEDGKCVQHTRTALAEFSKRRLEQVSGN